MLVENTRESQNRDGGHPDLGLVEIQESLGGAAT